MSAVLNFPRVRSSGSASLRLPLGESFAHQAAPRAAVRRDPILDAVLNRIAEGIIVIDAGGRVLHLNRAARELLSRLQAPRNPGGLLAFADRGTQRAFEHALAACGAVPQSALDAQLDAWAETADWNSDDAPAAPRQFLVRDVAGLVLARATLESLQRCTRANSEVPQWLVTLHARPADTRVCDQALRALYGLTDAESRVAATVVLAGQVEALATRLRVSRNTVKSHLKQVFRKCGVSSLAELAALVATGPRRL